MPVRQTLERLGISRATFYRWYDRHLIGDFFNGIRQKQPFAEDNANVTQSAGCATHELDLERNQKLWDRQEHRNLSLPSALARGRQMR